VNVLFTVAVLAVAGVWALAVYVRLARLRDQVKLAWKRLETDQSNEAVKSVYNKHVTIYNDALSAFPANLVGPAAGFKAAKHF
jgi:hypothetical protein